MLSKKAKYGLKAMTVLAREYGNGPILIEEIAKRERIPPQVSRAHSIGVKEEGVSSEQERKRRRLLPKPLARHDFRGIAHSGARWTNSFTTVCEPDGLRALR